MSAIEKKSAKRLVLKGNNTEYILHYCKVDYLAVQLMLSSLIYLLCSPFLSRMCFGDRSLLFLPLGGSIAKGTHLCLEAVTKLKIIEQIMCNQNCGNCTVKTIK